LAISPGRLAEQIEWINKMRGKYIGKRGKNLTTTAFLRAVVSHSERMSWAEQRRGAPGTDTRDRLSGVASGVSFVRVEILQHLRTYQV
jgi:hypothetical protein